jgi:hypothetical protein
LDHPGRTNISVRSTRANLAGLGTSGSLLAGAAALFLVASAIVGFRGWPQVGAGPAHSYVSGSAVAVASRTARRLTVALRNVSPAGSARAARGIPRRLARAAGGGPAAPTGGATQEQSTGATYVGGVPAGTAGSARPPASARTPRSGGGSHSGSCSGDCNGGPQNLVVRLTDKLAQTVSSVGNQVGNQLSSATQSAGNQLSGLNPPAGGAVSSAGTTAGGAVTGASNSGASVISATGNTLGGGH